MHIIKFKNGNLNIRAESFDERHIDALATSDEMFWNDLTFFMSGMDGFQYIYDTNKQLLYQMNDYGYDEVEKFTHGLNVKLTSCDMNDDSVREIVSEYFKYDE